MKPTSPIGRNHKENTMLRGEIAMTIPDRVKQVVLEAGIPENQMRKKIAFICGISPQAVTQWFSGSTKAPAADHLASIAAYFEADLMWVIKGVPNGPTLVRQLREREMGRIKAESLTGRIAPAKVIPLPEQTLRSRILSIVPRH